MDQGDKYSNKKKETKLVDGKMPPQAVELEEAVLGALMLEDCVNDIANILEPKSFYKDAHCRIYAAILNLLKQSYPVDVRTVVQELKRTEELSIVGGAYYISQLTNSVASSSHVEYHARIVQQKFIQRELIRISTISINDAYEEGADVFDLLDKAEMGLFSISKNSYKKEAKNSAQLVNEYVKNLETIAAKPDGLSGIPSGIKALDRITLGWQPGDLVIIAARPSMGKTALGVSVAKNAAVKFNIPVAFFSLEVSELKIMAQMVSKEAQINGYALQQPKSLTEDHWKEINRATGIISNAPLFIDDTSSLSVFELRAKARRMKEKHGIKLIVVDYLQLMTTGVDNGKGNREQEISLISRSLKAVAKDLDVPVLALSQLSRAVETRGGDKRPQLSDLRESGAIEQDADLVIFPHRPEYYNIKEDSEGNSTIGKAELIVAKHRNGALDTALTEFIGKFTLFTDVHENIENAISPNKTFVNPNKFTEATTEEDLPF